MVQYKLVSVEGGRLQAVEFSDNKVYSEMENRGYSFEGVNKNKHNRAELQDQPIFKGLCGPMYDGPGCIRYETKEAYQILSN